MSKVADWLTSLKQGGLTVDEVAEKMRGLNVKPQRPPVGDVFWKGQLDDVVPEGPGVELMQAYYDGLLTDAQYGELYAALGGPVTNS